MAAAVAGACLGLAALTCPPLASPAAAAEPAAASAISPPEHASRPAALETDPAASSPDFETRWLETAGAVAPRVGTPEDRSPKPQRRGKEQPGLTILQIGDSHTAADFFTGELRRRLQALFGNGGAGYITAGKPHVGVRSSTFRITTSTGWTYKSLNRATEPSEFWLSGYNAIATETGQTMTFAADQFVPFDAIEIETIRQPGGGSIDIKLDGHLESQYDLNADKVEPIVIRLVPEKVLSHFVKQITITTTAAGTVNLASVSVYNRRAGLSYNAVGFPGAQITYLDKFEERVFASELHRLSPQIVVLAFGTNEGFREDLDLTAYAESYERAVTRIKTILPGAVIVVVAPPDSRQLPAHCKEKPGQATCKPARLAASTAPAEGGECVWRTPPNVNRVREIQQEIANRHKLVYWNWASIMPEECGAHRWAAASPPLMAKDHVHLTVDGYKKSAGEFLNTLIPVIRELRARSNVVSNN